MNSYEYLVLPAPSKGAKAKGLKTAADRYAHQLTTLLNDLATEGWEFWRADTLASDERKGLTGTKRVTHELLVFRRLSAETLAAQMPTQSTPARASAPQDFPRAEPQLGQPEGRPDDVGPRLTADRRD
mgnify:CR=1 FL=1